MKVIVCCLWLIALPVESAAAEPARTIKIAFGDNTLPYTLPDSKDKLHLGISVDVIRESLENAGYKVEPQFVPYARRLILYKSGQGSQAVDAAVDVIDGYVKEYDLQGYMSVPTLSYQNVAISLKKRNLGLKTIADLTPYSVLAWQGASTVLGAEYAKMTTANAKYSETADQSSQVKRLYLGRIEVVQMAETIFLYWKKVITEEMRGTIDTSQPVEIVAIVPPISYSVLFKSAQVRADFDREYQKLVANGRLAEIIAHYIK